MRSREELYRIMDLVCADVRDHAVGAIEVAERLVVVTDTTAEVQHSAGTARYEDGGVIAFVNDSGVPFVEQSDELVARAVEMKPVAVLLGGSGVIGRPGGSFRKVLAVQLFSTEYGIRTTRIAPLEVDAEGFIREVQPWQQVKAGPSMWAEKILVANE